MNSKKIIFSFFVAFVAFACTKDEILNEKENSFPNPEVTDHIMEYEAQLSGKSRTLTPGRDSDVTDDSGGSQRDLLGTPLCTEIGDGFYDPVLVTYSNFSSDRFMLRVFDISNIRTGYNAHYNQGDCQLVIIPTDSGSITCEGETCTEIWYFYRDNEKPEGGGTVDIDVEAPGP